MAKLLVTKLPMTPLVVKLSDTAAADAGRFGPKAANQALLGSAGLPIPEGFCLDAEAYRIQLRTLGLLASARKAATLEGEAARPYLSEVRIGLFDSSIVPQVLEPLRRAWRELVGNSGAPTVVRSSALMEDTAASSFAGQFETFLGLEKEEDFLTAVRACWAALWSPRARRYMEARHLASQDLSPGNSAMALCVQALIEARMSGGGMSRTADGKMLLSATWGLGTTIAQGEVVPDRYLLAPDGELMEAVAGRKQRSVHCPRHSPEYSPHNRLHPTASGTDAPAGEETASRLCLSESQVIELGQMMKQAERLLGTPVEIEWANDGTGFKMLQARPLNMEPVHLPDDIWLRHPGLRGHPSGIGWGMGRACVINCECELSRLAPGDILVTRVASPALSEVLPRVAGLVAELGGSTSHLASLARERGIPMVLGVPEATDKIPDGARVGVDGVMGVVRWQS